MDEGGFAAVGGIGGGREGLDNSETGRCVVVGGTDNREDSKTDGSLEGRGFIDR